MVTLSVRNHAVYDTICLRFFCGHIVIAIGISFYYFQRLTCIGRKNFVQSPFCLGNVICNDLNFCCLSLCSADG